jgi:hypothetical protein
MPKIDQIIDDDALLDRDFRKAGGENRTRIISLEGIVF